MDQRPSPIYTDFLRKGYTFFELFGDFLILFEKRPLLSLEAVVESVFCAGFDEDIQLGFKF